MLTSSFDYSTSKCMEFVRNDGFKCISTNNTRFSASITTRTRKKTWNLTSFLKNQKNMRFEWNWISLDISINVKSTAECEMKKNSSCDKNVWEKRKGKKASTTKWFLYCRQLWYGLPNVGYIHIYISFIIVWVCVCVCVWSGIDVHMEMYVSETRRS